MICLDELIDTSNLPTGASIYVASVTVLGGYETEIYSGSVLRLNKTIKSIFVTKLSLVVKVRHVTPDAYYLPAEYFLDVSLGVVCILDVLREDSIPYVKKVITLEDIRVRKTILEKEVYELLRDFMSENDVSISSVDVDFSKISQLSGGEFTVTNKVTVEVVI